MRKILSLLAVLGALIGASLAPSTASAATNCAALPGMASGLDPAPMEQAAGIGFNLTAHMGICTGVEAIEIRDYLFIGGSGLSWEIDHTWAVSGTSGVTYQHQIPAGCKNQTGGCSQDLYTHTTGCPVDPHPPYPSYHNGIPYWWAHRFTFRLRNAATHTWGSTTPMSVDGAGIYVAC